MRDPYTSSPPYLVGLLCLIPLVGAFVGIVLIILGLVKYKDKLLTIIGAFGVLFTIGVYSFLFYYMKNGDLSKQGFAQISQMQLNSLIKNIEFYNIENGHYPDNLKDLLQKDNVVSIYDPIQTVQQRENTMYNYEKTGDKYQLFSSGEDGVPKTSDDLFPVVTISDSSRIGYIRVR